MPSPPLRKLVDWSDEAGPIQAWLARWAAAGWFPEHGQGARTDIHGQTVTRWAMIRASQENAT